MRSNQFFPIAALVLCAAACLHLRASESDESADKETPPVLKADDPSGKLDFKAVELIAVQDGGRKKPLQTYAFEIIEQIAGRPLLGSTFVQDPVSKAKLNSMDLFLSLWFHPTYWQDKPVILCPNAELRKLIHAVSKPKFEDEKRIAVTDLIDYSEPENPHLFKEFKAILESAEAKIKAKKEGDVTAVENEAKLVYIRMQMVGKIRQTVYELAILPHWNSSTGTWQPLGEIQTYLSTAIKEGAPAEMEAKAKKTLDAYFAFKAAYRERNPELFSKAAVDFRQSLADLSPSIYPSYDALNREIAYNNTRPFGWAWVLYLCAVIVGVLALKVRPQPFYYIAMALYLSGLGMHVYGFVLRCLIAGRPPVSNMYESVIWVGFGAVLFGLIFELIYKRVLFMLSGGMAGFLCLVLMDLIPVMTGNTKTEGFSDDIKPLLPVLRDNFWLTIHVLTITLSYAAFMLAWGMGHISLWSHLTRPNEKHEHRDLHNLVYRVMQVGVLLLAIGTILGGVWAYYSWGRFWGWDPKETWAFIALMCYIVVLHGRFAGLWTNFGLAFGSVFCFQAIVMAWYGVNFVLGSGKHAYGAGANNFWVIVFVTAAVGLDMIFLTAATVVYLGAKKKLEVARDSESADGDDGDGGWKDDSKK